MAHLALSMLGAFEVRLDDHPVTGFESAKVRALLAYLILEAARPHRREFLASFFWPDLPDEVARSNLRQALANLRRVIGDASADPPFLDVTRDHIQFNRESDYWFDVDAFTALLATTATHAHRRATTCSPCRQSLGQAVDLYHGPLLAEFFLGDSSDFETWVASKRDRLQQQALDALARLAAGCEARGRYDQTQEYARRQLELDPWREEAYRQLMRALWLAGDRSAALAQYERCRRLLAQEIGVEPDEETTALYERIRSGEPGIDDRAGLAVSSLPRPLTPFIGRERELIELGRLIEQPSCCLITVFGLGGAGKTRLALEAAAEQRATFGDGVYFVPLAQVSSGFLVPALASALSLTFNGPVEPIAQLIAYLRSKQLLLVLDNVEHLLGPDDSTPDLIVEILQQAPGVVVLATSRERLQLQGEWVLEIAGLPYPLAEETVDPVEHDAVRLFVERAQRAQPGYDLTADDRAQAGRICRLVTGLPLGIELAAATLRTRTYAEIADAIEQSLLQISTTYRDVPARHRSLHAVLDYSWSLLLPDEQRVLRRLAVFRGGFGAPAVDAVSASDERSGSIDHASSRLETLLAALGDKSLLQRTDGQDGDTRFTLHELVRQYAHEQLDAAGEMESARERHLAWYLAFAQVASPELTGRQQTVWLARLAAEHDNLRAALQWSIERMDVERSLRLASALWWFWNVHSHLTEGRHWLDIVLRLAATHASEHALAPDLRLVEADVINGAGVLAHAQGDYAATLRYYEQSLAARRALGNRRGIASVLTNLGAAAEEQGDLPAAQAYYEQGLASYRELGDSWGIAVMLTNLGVLAVHHQRDYTAARSLLVEGLSLFSDIGDGRGIGASLANLGITAEAQEDYAAARSYYEQGLAVYRELGGKRGIANALVNLGRVTHLEGNYSAALALLRESLAMFQELDSQPGIAEAIEWIAAGAAAHGNAERALRLVASAAALRSTIGMPLRPLEQAALDRALAPARASLAAAGVAAAWHEGSTMTRAQAIGDALS